jgi:anti-sigma28 factor (negative regulator of flagellin synthesis)
MDHSPQESPPLSAENSGKTGGDAPAASRRKTSARKSERAAQNASGDEILRARQERLAAIRKAVEAGEYDSEDLLEKALERMISRIRSGTSEV